MRRLALALAVLAALPPLAASDPVWLALSIGQEEGGPGDVRLRYAERDARRVHDVWTTLGEVAPARATLLTDASADGVRQAIRQIEGRAAELTAAGHQPIVLVYVSSHADGQALRLGETRLPHWELRALLAAIPAQLRLLVVDACASGAMIRGKGAAIEAPFAVPAATLSGQVILTAAGPAEPAQEWDALGGALFTHNLVSALRGAGDADGDGAVTLAEAHSYAYERTLALSSAARLGPQHPSHEIELRGTGDLVLTRPARGAVLLLGRGLSGRYVISSEDGELVAEANKRSAAPLRLALPPGRYLVRKPEGGFVRLGTVEVRAGAVTRLDEDALERVPGFDATARGPGVARERSVEATFALTGGTVAGQRDTARFGLAYRRGLGPLELFAGVELGRAALEGRVIAGRSIELWGHGGARWRRPLGWLLPYVGVEVGAAAVRQRVEAGVMGPATVRHGAAFEGLGALGAELAIAPRLVVRLELAGGWLVPQLADGPGGRLATALRSAIGWRW